MIDSNDSKPIDSNAGSFSGAPHSAPYPMSRLGAPFSLVNAAREIEKADFTLVGHLSGKLQLIADQIRGLQEQAKALLTKAERDAALHRADCRFEKKPGETYHLYRRMDSGRHWFSLMAPDDWSMTHNQEFVGSYRLENDMSFTAMFEVADVQAAAEMRAAP